MKESMKIYVFTIFLIGTYSLKAEVDFPIIQTNKYEMSDCFVFDKTRNFIGQLVGVNDLVFDVGAHVGKMTEVYLALGARVICFEPQTQCVRELLRKFGSNGNVVIEQQGIASSEGSMPFLECSQCDMLSTFSKEWTQKGRFADHNYTWNKQKMIAVTTLDAMIAKYGVPRYCKIDVENFEYEVLKGLSTPIKYISFESAIEYINNSIKCIELLQKLGYRKFNFSVAESASFLFNEWITGEVLIQSLIDEASNDNWKRTWGFWGDIFAQYD